MNENLDLVEILKDCPKGTKLYMSVIGEEVMLTNIGASDAYPIRVYTDLSGAQHLTRYGQLYHSKPNGECVLWPSKECRDWSKFKASVKKFDYSTLKPFDRVLVRDNDRDIWRCSLFTCFRKDQIVCEVSWEQGIPDNDETKHLIGTTDKPDEKYIWWKD